MHVEFRFKYFYAYGLTGELSEEGMNYIAEMNYDSLQPLESLESQGWENHLLDVDSEGCAVLTLGEKAIDILSGIYIQLYYVAPEEDALAIYQSAYPDAVIQSFENGIEINGNESLVAMVNVTTPGGSAVTIVLVFITDGTSNYVANFTHGRDNTDSALAKNIQTCIESIMI